MKAGRLSAVGDDAWWAAPLPPLSCEAEGESASRDMLAARSPPWEDEAVLQYAWGVRVKGCMECRQAALPCLTLYTNPAQLRPSSPTAAGCPRTCRGRPQAGAAACAARLPAQRRPRPAAAPERRPGAAPWRRRPTGWPSGRPRAGPPRGCSEERRRRRGRSKGSASAVHRPGCWAPLGCPSWLSLAAAQGACRHHSPSPQLLPERLQLGGKVFHHAQGGAAEALHLRGGGPPPLLHNHLADVLPQARGGALQGGTAVCVSVCVASGRGASRSQRHERSCGASRPPTAAPTDTGQDPCAMSPQQHSPCRPFPKLLL